MVCDFMFDGMVVVQGCITAGNSRKIASKPVLERERREGLGDDICAVMPWTFNCVSVLERSLCLLSTSKRKSALRMGFLKSVLNSSSHVSYIAIANALKICCNSLSSSQQ